MRRRTVLAVVPALLASCLGTNDRDDSTTTHSTPTTTEVATTTAATTTHETTETTTETAAATEHPYEFVPIEPASMTADEVRARLAGRDCAGLVDRPTTCPGDDASLDVTISPTVGDLPDGAVEFTIANRADESFIWNAYDWQLQKWDGNRWRRIAPLAIPAPLHGIAAGDAHTYRISTGDGYARDGQGSYVAETEISVGGLSPGVYGFSTNGHFESTHDEEFAAAGVFGLAGEGYPINHTYIDPLVERNGSELLVRSVVPEHRPDELFISLVDGEPDARLLPEHVHQLRPLLNALPYAATDGIDVIRYDGNSNDVAFVDPYLSAVTPEGTSRYGFDEFVFEVSKTRP